MKKIRILILGILLIRSSAFGAPITSELAKDAALTQLEAIETITPADAQGLKRDRQSLPAHTISGIKSLLNDQGDTLAFVLQLEPTGYIVISPDTDIRPVIAYSMDTNFSFTDFPENALLHLVQGDMENRLAALGLIPDEHKEKNNLLWEQYLKKDQNLLSELTATQKWGPYITTAWGQYDPYNKYCPMDPETGSRSVVGCAATATAQILNYWKYPTTLHFDENDRYETYTRSIKIDEDHDLYDFPSFDELNQMLLDIDYDDVYDIIALNFAVGIRLGMNYTSTGSGANGSAGAFIAGFNYGNATDVDSSSAFFYDLLINNMKQKRPALLSVYKEDT